MRYFIVLWIFLMVVAVSVLGPRGALSRKPPIEIFPDMDFQAKIQAEHPSEFFADGRGSRLPVPGTVPHTAAYTVNGQPYLFQGKPVYSFEDLPINTGQAAGATNFVLLNPLPITPQLLARGKDRFAIFCSPCHGALADGTGITKRLGMLVVGNLHDPRIVSMGDGEIFYVITHGRNLMGPYGPVLPPPDRWAVVAYVRSLQLSQIARVDDVPAAERAALQK